MYNILFNNYYFKVSELYSELFSLKKKHLYIILLNDILLTPK